MMSFSTHHLLATFTHKSSVTVAELRDYITRRKNKKISIVKRGKNACTCFRLSFRVRIETNVSLDPGLSNAYPKTSTSIFTS